MDTTAKAGAPSSEQDYVHTLLSAYTELPETPQRCHATDRRIARDCFRRQIPLAVVDAAFILGSARRLARDPQRIVPPIRCLAYFVPVIEEVLAQPPPPLYIQWLRLRLRAAQKADPTG